MDVRCGLADEHAHYHHLIREAHDDRMDVGHCEPHDDNDDQMDV